VPIKSRQLCRIELRSREVWPAGLEPAPRRVSGDRSTVAELRPHGDGRGWTRTSSLLFVRQALSALELLAQGGFGGRPLVVGVRCSFADKDAVSSNSGAIRATEDAAQRASSVRRRHSLPFAKPPKLRDKDSNLDLRVQSAVSWPLDDPGKKRLAYVSSRELLHGDVVHATRLRFGPGSCPLAAALPRWARPSWRRFGARRSRVLRQLRRQKPPLHKQRRLPRRSARGPFSLRRGLDFLLGLLQAEHHLWLRAGC
jgi:hypothetical protein